MDGTRVADEAQNMLRKFSYRDRYTEDHMFQGLSEEVLVEHKGNETLDIQCLPETHWLTSSALNRPLHRYPPAIHHVRRRHWSCNLLLEGRSARPYA